MPTKFTKVPIWNVSKNKNTLFPLFHLISLSIFANFFKGFERKATNFDLQIVLQRIIYSLSVIISDASKNLINL